MVSVFCSKVWYSRHCFMIFILHEVECTCEIDIILKDLVVTCVMKSNWWICLEAYIGTYGVQTSYLLYFPSIISSTWFHSWSDPLWTENLNLFRSASSLTQMLLVGFRFIEFDTWYDRSIKFWKFQYRPHKLSPSKKSVICGSILDNKNE